MGRRPPDRTSRLPAGLVALRERNFSLYITGQATSQIGSLIEATAVAWILYELTGSPLLLGIGGMLRAVPLIVLSLLAGAIADRVNRRTVVMVCESSAGVLSAGVGLLAMTGNLVYWHLYVLNVVGGTLTALSVPSRQSLFPTLVPREAVPSAVALNSTAVRGAALFGPAIAGLALTTSGYAAPFFLNAVSYFVIVACLLAMRLPGSTLAHRAASASTSLMSGVVDGALFVWRDPILRALVLLEMLSNLFGQNPALITILARDVLGTGPDGLGVLLASAGAGAVLGIVALLVIKVEHRGRIILILGMVYAVGLVGVGLSRSLVLSAGLLFLVGMADSLWGITRNTIAQLVVPDAMRGRVMSIVVLMSRGFYPLGQIQTGIITAIASAPGSALVGGVVIAAGIAASLLDRNVRSLWTRTDDELIARDDVAPASRPEAMASSARDAARTIPARRSEPSP